MTVRVSHTVDTGERVTVRDLQNALNNFTNSGGSDDALVQARGKLIVLGAAERKARKAAK